MKHKILIPFSCYIPESPYICNVFFIVLDLRLTKVGVQRYSFFCIRFKVNKGWSTAVLLFLCLYMKIRLKKVCFLLTKYIRLQNGNASLLDFLKR